MRAFARYATCARKASGLQHQADDLQHGVEARAELGALAAEAGRDARVRDDRLAEAGMSRADARA